MILLRAISGKPESSGVERGVGGWKVKIVGLGAAFQEAEEVNGRREVRR